MPRLFSVLLALLLTVPATAQEPDHDAMHAMHHGDQAARIEVESTIDRLFDGMRAGDSSAVRSVFGVDASLVTTFSRDGQPMTRTTPADAFVAAVGSPHDQVWDERVWNLEIDVRDNLASAWMDYAFYIDDQLSHCGVNAMQLARNGDGDWKLIAVADTRTAAAACDLPADEVEASAVRAALRNYLRGHATGDGSYHERVFHPVSSLYWMRDGELNQRPSAEYIAGAPGSPAPDEADRVRYIDWVDVTGTAAVARIVLDYPGAYLVDYMSLLKVDGRWQIVNKIFDVGAAR